MEKSYLKACADEHRMTIGRKAVGEESFVGEGRRDERERFDERLSSRLGDGQDEPR